ncbi:MAG: hypothetical protein IK092_07135, partial [Muribaculaceae bacterium]|nr:hypothetical protein [Muribaculaceae bacterium]
FSPNSKKPFKAEEINEMRKFMTNFSNEVDVIWGVAYDDTLEDKIKITILAAGFNITMGNEVDKGRSHIEVTRSTASKNETKIIAEEYGESKIKQQALESAKARYLVLQPQDIDNDELIELFEKNPTFGRGPEFKTLVKEIQSMPLTTPKAERPADPPQHGGTSTISF